MVEVDHHQAKSQTLIRAFQRFLPSLKQNSPAMLSTTAIRHVIMGHDNTSLLHIIGEGVSHSILTHRIANETFTLPGDVHVPKGTCLGISTTHVMEPSVWPDCN